MKWKTFSLEEEHIESYEHIKISYTGILATNLSRTFFKIVCVKTTVCICPVK